MIVERIVVWGIYGSANFSPVHWTLHEPNVIISSNDLLYSEKTILTLDILLKIIHSSRVKMLVKQLIIFIALAQSVNADIQLVKESENVIMNELINWLFEV